MIAVDTNILVYAANEDCAEHGKAIRLVNDALASPRDWIIAEQVLFEYYKALRHPRILSKPLGAPAAAEQIRFLRERSGFMVCCYEIALWGRMLDQLSRRDFLKMGVSAMSLVALLEVGGASLLFMKPRDNEGEFGGEKYSKVTWS